MANREENDEAARTFEEKADEVLNECHQEDRNRAQLLLCRKLEYYGNTSAIRLAARGRCIRFMAHPCCQDVLSGIWMGQLSTKSTWIQLSISILIGFTLPVLLPFVMKYKNSMNDNEVVQSADNAHLSTVTETGGHITGSDEKIESSANITMHNSCSLICNYIKRIVDFYRAPVTRFIYTSIFYLIFLFVFSNLLLQSYTVKISIKELFVITMVASLLLEELKQALGPGASIKEYIGDGWNQLDCVAIILYLIGLSLRTRAYFDTSFDEPETLPIGSYPTFSNGSFYEFNKTSRDDQLPFNKMILDANSDQVNQGFMSAQYGGIIATTLSMGPENVTRLDQSYLNDYRILNDEIFTVSRIFYSLSLFAFFVRLMYIFSFSMVLGPKLIMINRMVIHDLIPFLAILVVCQMGYGLAFHSVSYANGLFIPQDVANIPRDYNFTSKSGFECLYDVFSISYFQMVGEFRRDELEGDDPECREKGMCPQVYARSLNIIMLSAYVLLTQVLMFNLLVATFTSTYHEIEGSSQYFWCYQRYEMIQEFVDKPSVAPPFMLVWYLVEFIGYILGMIINYMCGNAAKPEDDPFCNDISKCPNLNQKLTKWEQMIGSRRTRIDTDGVSAGKWAGGTRADGHAIIFRAGGGVTGSKGLPMTDGAASHRDAKTLLQSLGPMFGPETEFIEHRFHEFGTQLNKLSTMEEKLNRISQSSNQLIQSMNSIAKSQDRILALLNRKDGRRLVGRGKSRARKTRNPIVSAVFNAITGLDSHCKLIEDKITEKIKIEELCVKAVLTRSEQQYQDTPTVKTDGHTRIERKKSSTGRIVERVLLSHRLWRIVPFNFELYPGIRMNVPDEKIPWKVPYQEYHPFKVSGDFLNLPYPDMEDRADISPGQLVYNEYDNIRGVSRKPARGRVHVCNQTDTSPTLVGYPLNPAGRSGLHGKGLLLHWGPNHTIVVALTRKHPEKTMRQNLPMIQVAALSRNQNYCLPWYLTDHRMDCDFANCSATLIKTLMQCRINAVLRASTDLQNAIKSFKSAELSMIHSGYLHDHLNADHAWLEVCFLNMHEDPKCPFPDLLLKVFQEDDPSEQVMWLNVDRHIGMRSSHDELLKRLAVHHDAFFVD